MGFQNENKLKVGALVKATINNKVVEAKVISIGFNRVTLRSEKGNEAAYAFNSEKFLKWFKLAFGFKTTDDKTSFEIIAEDYTLSEKKSRLGALLSPMFFEGSGNQASAIILTALHYAKGLNKHSDAEWRAMIDNRDEEKCEIETLDHLDRVGTTLFCGMIKEYAEGNKEFEKELNDFSPDGFWATTLPKNKNEALFIAQLLCDGGINKYGLSCAGLTENLLKDIFNNIGLATAKEVDEHLAELDKEEAELKE
ncbi:hypothetical protein KVL73_04715 [Helicobacter pylori]|nr:hypothetical protein KVM03_04720 [Helicobacter pylori]WRA57512.1 hypothetical protein KVL73_04715 [Helicobacter pylori]